MFSRLLFLIFFCLGGFLFYIPKWLLMGTKGSRERRTILRQQQQILQTGPWQPGQPMWPPPQEPTS